jgi:hypothetical protein
MVLLYFQITTSEYDVSFGHLSRINIKSVLKKKSGAMRIAEIYLKGALNLHGVRDTVLCQ